MAIPDEDVAQVRAVTDLVALVGEHVSLKRQGRRWVGLCPFHSEKTPSFSVNSEEGLYYCFGCMASGDAITFVRAVEHIDFAEAVERLAERSGIVIHREDERSGQDRARRRRLLDAMSSAVDWYHERLLSHPDAGAARDYLRSRGYDGDVVRSFRLGWAPAAWDTLARALHLPDSVLRDTGLGFVNRAGRQQDAFRGRVLFPIFDTSNAPVALGGRLLPGPDGGPKYKNSQESPIYSKRRTLYGLNWAKSEVVQTGEVVVCEGYTDVIAFVMAGVKRAVATCGTSLADDHITLLKRFGRRVVLAYDADAAGQAAAERVYEWERKHELDVAVAALPDGSDPAEVGRKDPDLLRAAVESARPFLDFRIERVLGLADLHTVEGRTRAAEAAVAAIAEHPNQLVRDQYLMQVAGACRVEPDRLRELLARSLRRGPGAAGRGAVARDTSPVIGGPRRRPSRMASGSGEHGGPEEERQREPAAVGARDGGTGSLAATEALRLAVHRRGELPEMLHESLFGDPLQRATFRAISSTPNLKDAIDRADPESTALLQRLAVEDTEAEPYDVIARMAVQAGARVLAELKAEASASDARALDLAPTIGWLAIELDRLREPPPDFDALERLVAFVKQRVEEGT